MDRHVQILSGRFQGGCAGVFSGFACCVGTCLILLGVVTCGWAEADNRSGRIQAALVYYAAKFVEWPMAEGKELHVCSLSDDDVSAALESTVRGKQIQGKALVVRTIVAGPRLGRAATYQDLRGCNVLYLGKETDSTTLAALAEWLKKNPGILTICGVHEVRANGCVVQMYEQNNKAKLAVDRKLVDYLGLRLSSEFLEVAGTVP